MPVPTGFAFNAATGNERRPGEPTELFPLFPVRDGSQTGPELWAAAVGLREI